MCDLNALYRKEPALHELDCDRAGFEWVDCTDAEAGVVSLLRKGATGGRCCCSPAISRRCRGMGIGSACRTAARWDEVLNSDAPVYGGSGTRATVAACTPRRKLVPLRADGWSCCA